MDALRGVVDRVVYSNADNGYIVARMTIVPRKGKRDVSVSIAGSLPTVQAGEMIEVWGEWTSHPSYGETFRVQEFQPIVPEGVKEIERYLGSGRIRGIGPITAARIVDTFGEDTLQILDQTPDRLSEVGNINDKRIQTICDAWREHQEVRALTMFLQQHDLHISLAPKIYAAYGEDAVARIREDPYRLVHDIEGVGFKTADSVARAIGVPANSPSRYVAGLLYVLTDAADAGHVYLPREQLLQQGTELLAAPTEILETALLEAIRLESLVIENDHVYLIAFYHAEAGVARVLGELMDGLSPLAARRREALETVQQAADMQGLKLAHGQMDALRTAVTEKISVLTGGPGTGKTSTLRTVIAVLEFLEMDYCLCAPTGRAAKRVAETTDRPASTIHRLLEFQPATQSFGYDRSRPLPHDFIIVDEASMLDIFLFYNLLKAIPSHAHLLLVGDADQLPSVGPGNVLHDLIHSHSVPTIALTELFRQARGSQIVLGAHAVNSGEMPLCANLPEHDLFFIDAQTDDQAVAVIKRLVSERVPQRYGFHPVEDIQVISPMHGGLVGVTALNVELQTLLNPDSPDVPAVRRAEKIFRLNDKVMQVRNNYDKNVFNGDVGTVVDVDVDERALLVRFPLANESYDVPYENKEIDELSLAYAISVHKAQGSEFPCIVMPLVVRHKVLLQRNLLYTAMTRASQLCVLVGSREALEYAVRTDHRHRRNSGLKDRLQNAELATGPLELLLS